MAKMTTAPSQARTNKNYICNSLGSFMAYHVSSDPSILVVQSSVRRVLVLLTVISSYPSARVDGGSGFPAASNNLLGEFPV